jgi:hypothetical protein
MALNCGYSSLSPITNAWVSGLHSAFHGVVTVSPVYGVACIRGGDYQATPQMLCRKFQLALCAVTQAGRVCDGVRPPHSAFLTGL